MTKYNKKAKGKEARAREEFNPSARDPFMGKKKTERVRDALEDLDNLDEYGEYKDEDDLDEEDDQDSIHAKDDYLEEEEDL